MESGSGPESGVEQTLDHLFRREAGRLVCVLTKVFGGARLDLVENVVQEALLQAAQTWPYQGFPKNPAGWLHRVARNRAIDELRRDRRLVLDPQLLEAVPEQDQTPTAAFESELVDDQLRLMFLCCHPCLSPEARVALTLKTVCGFGTGEIARAFFTKEETVAQRVVRAKQKIREAGLVFELPPSAELVSRLDSVLDTIYLLFNGGYAAFSGEVLVRDDICREACRLIALLSRHPIGNVPKSHALAALLFFQASRLSARLDPDGAIVLLGEQDRSRWDRNMIAAAFAHLDLAAAGEALSEFHLHAAIAACHASAPSLEGTDWSRIESFYDVLLQTSPSAVIALNRAVAVSFTRGPRIALEELKKIAIAAPLQNYYYFTATQADFHRRLGEHEQAVQHYRQALGLVQTTPERNFLEGRLKESLRQLTATPQT